MPERYERSPRDRWHQRADGGTRAGRAAQFMPFAALRGYYELLSEQMRVPEERRELTEEEARSLSSAFSGLRPRAVVRVRYYDRDATCELTGCVTHIDPAERALTVVRTRIPFDDIYALTILDA